jgi:hypothetical protein
MGISVLILGDSGTGKTTSLRNFQPGEVAIINVAKKPLPFRTQLRPFNTNDYKVAYEAVQGYVRKGAKSIVLDDIQYLMTDEFMRRSSEIGYAKYTDMAVNYNSLFDLAPQLPDDVILYLMSHIERDELGHESPRTVGKLVHEKLCVEGKVTITLHTYVESGHYYFRTHSSGEGDITKSPLGMFEQDLIDNDLKAVDQIIREYYGFGGKNNAKN